MGEEGKVLQAILSSATVTELVDGERHEALDLILSRVPVSERCSAWNMGELGSVRSGPEEGCLSISSLPRLEHHHLRHPSISGLEMYTPRSGASLSLFTSELEQWAMLWCGA
ncbi:hypothetical protein EYF80_013081 [Liparis tanakae]|uniref:Uncharacterized protein n=1 Tax=Liparis tanakae TaxID=230148 RepID=A0A4Z2IF18_9TELE|nr:hypothetical protein EYF80_013081 [Liparis tanakae]